MTFLGDRSKRRGNGPAWGSLAMLAMLLLAGCSAKERTATVTGKVVMDGAAVSAGSVQFLSDDGKAASAKLEADGTYKVQCRLGRFKVAVSPPPPPDPLASPGGAGAQPSVAIPLPYQEVSSSGLSTEVKEGNNTFDISLTKSGPRK